MKNSDKIILDLCGGTGFWSKPYKDAGYDVRVITLPDCDVRTYQFPENVYGVLAAPPCTMFSFARTKAKTPRDLEAGMDVVRACFNIIWNIQEIKQATGKKTLPLKFWALENPAHGFLKSFLGKPAFVFDPCEFGENYKKKTAIWGNFNEPTKGKNLCEDLPKFDKLKSKDIHSNRFGELTRQERRAITPQGFANAFFKANP